MTCTQMLEQLIEADPDALAGRGSSDVAAHLRECARCRAVAQQLLADTRMLANTVKHGAVSRRVRPIVLAPALAAAATAAFLLMPERPQTMSTARPVAGAPQVTVAPVVVAPVAASPATSPAASSRTSAASSPAPRPARQLARAFPAATPVAASPVLVAPSEASYPQVAVTLAPGKRAAVMRTNDPTITVVWVY